MTYTISNPNATISEAQFGYLLKLIGQAYAADPATRAAELIKVAGYSKGEASAKIEQLKPQAAAAPAVMPAYVPPFGHYMIDGKHVHVKKAKYTDAVYVYVNDGYVGTLGKKAEAAAAIAQLDSADAAYSAVVAFAAVTSKCGVCHTKLKDPKSIAAGIGPVCAKKYGKSI